MAERRMFAKSVVLSDAFLDLPAGARSLYFFMGIQADDDGFLNAPSSLVRMCGACPDDLRLLVNKGFLIAFDSGIMVIAHWRIHNLLKKDRYRPTLYRNEWEMLTVDERGVYCRAEPGEDASGTQSEPNRNQSGTQMEPNRNQSGTKLEPQDRLGKVSSVQVSSGEGSWARQGPFVPPSLTQVQSYCSDRKNQVDPQRFYDYYASNGWFVGKNPMRDWKAALRRWEGRDPPRPQKPGDIHGCTGLGEAELEAIRAVLREDLP